jgi:antitoxin HicB
LRFFGKVSQSSPSRVYRPQNGRRIASDPRSAAIKEDAVWQAADCLEEAIAGRITDGREIPTPSKFTRTERPIPVPAPMAAKAALYLAMREAGMTNVQLARKVGCDEREARRMLDPGHPTKLPRIQEALDVLG